MSAKATFWAWSVKGIHSSPKLVLLCLADYADENNTAWPSYETIKRQCEIKSDASVRKHIAYLEDHGLIKILKRKISDNPNAHHLSNLYELKVGMFITSKNEVKDCSLQNMKKVTSENEVSSLQKMKCVTSNIEEDPTNEPTNINLPMSRERVREGFDQIEHDRKFRMHLDWTPDEQLKNELTRLFCIQPDQVTEDQLLSFKNYWYSEARYCTERQWVSKFLEQCKRRPPSNQNDGQNKLNPDKIFEGL